MQLKGRMISNHAITSESRSSKESVDDPFLGVSMLWNGSENAAANAAEVPGSKMLSKHLRNDFVIGTAADSRGVFATAENGVVAEEWSGNESWHYVCKSNSRKFDYNHILHMASYVNGEVTDPLHTIL